MHFPVAPAGRDGVGEALAEAGAVVGKIGMRHGVSEVVVAGMVGVGGEIFD